MLINDNKLYTHPSGFVITMRFDSINKLSSPNIKINKKNRKVEKTTNTKLNLEERPECHKKGDILDIYA